MRWLNSLYIKELSDDDFFRLAQPFYDECPYLAGYDLGYLSTLLKNRCELLSDVGPLTAFIDAFDGYDLSLFVNKKWKTDEALAARMLPDLIGCAVPAIWPPRSNRTRRRTGTRRDRCCGSSASRSPAPRRRRAERPRWRTSSAPTARPPSDRVARPSESGRLRRITTFSEIKSTLDFAAGRFFDCVFRPVYAIMGV